MRRTTQQFSITLPNDMADLVRAKVASGEYATESEVLRDGVRALVARDRALEHWLRTEVAASMAEYKANPDDVLSIDQVRANLAAAHKAALAKSR